MTFPLRCFVLSLCAAFFAGCDRPPTIPDDPASSSSASEVNVYTGRHYDSDIAIYEAFTRKTGVKVNIIEASGDALIERLAREGEYSPADVFITADAGMLWRAKQRGVLRPIETGEIITRMSAQFRDTDNEWVGLSKRARIIIYDKAKGAPVGLGSYLDLAAPAFRGEICVRSSTNVYNQSLLASIIEHVGEEKAAEWARGVVANFARKPEGNDTSQIEAVAAGVCRISIINSYYLARFIGADDPKMRAIGDKVGVIFPDQATTGTHVNVSGAGVARFAPHPTEAEALIAFLLSDEIQRAFAAGNNEYPVVEGVTALGPISLFGSFRSDALDMAALGARQADAVRIFDKAGWR